MSGPKGASYQVVSAAELRRRAIQASQQRLTAALVRMHELQQLAGEYAARAGREPARRVATEPEQIDAQAAAVLTYCQKLESLAQERQIAVATSQVSAALADLDIDLAVDALPSGKPTFTANHQDELRAGLAELAGRVAELPGTERSAFVARLRAAATAIEGPDAARAAQVVGSLRSAVAAALHAAAESASFERRRTALQHAYADVATADPAAWLKAWQVPHTASDDVGLARARRVLDEARMAASRAADQRFVLAQAADALRALGYRVEVTDGDGADEIVARKDAWQHHGLRLLFPETQGAFSSVPEAYGATDARDDLAFEEASCRDVAAALEELGRRGVRTQVRTQLKAGSQPVRRVAPATKRRPRTAAPKEQAL